MYSAARNIGCPVVIYHGEEDEVVPVEQSERLDKTIKGAELVLFGGAGHIFNESEKEQVYQMCAGWFAEKLKI